MFTKDLPTHQGLLLVQQADSKINASIHMMFMWMDIAVFWINSDFRIVDKVLARRWKMIYIPKEPAKYMLEAGVSHLSEFNIGDSVRFEDTRVD